MTGAPSCAATRSASSTSSTICCPISTRARMSCCRSWSAAPTWPTARAARRASCSARSGLGAAPRPPPGQAVGRRAAARRGRPRARQPPAAGARRRADRQPRRGHRRLVFAEFLDLVRGEGSAALVATHNERLAAQDGPRRAPSRRPARMIEPTTDPAPRVSARCAGPIRRPRVIADVADRRRRRCHRSPAS